MKNNGILKLIGIGAAFLGFCCFLMAVMSLNMPIYAALCFLISFWLFRQALRLLAPPARNRHSESYDGSYEGSTHYGESVPDEFYTPNGHKVDTTGRDWEHDRNGQWAENRWTGERVERDPVYGWTYTEGD